MQMDPIIKAITKLGENHPNIDVVWLYGSRAKGTATVSSDYDLAVAFKTFPKDPWEQRLQPEELALDWAKEVGMGSDLLSVIDINHVPITLAFSVMEASEVIVENNVTRRIKEELRVSSMWEIDHMYHKEHYG